MRIYFNYKKTSKSELSFLHLKNLIKNFNIQVLECAKAGYNNFTGVELNGVLVLYSRLKSLQQGIKGVRFLKANIFKTSLEDYNVVVLFGTESIVFLAIFNLIF
jgi:hypothetical protein